MNEVFRNTVARAMYHAQQRIQEAKPRGEVRRKAAQVDVLRPATMKEYNESDFTEDFDPTTLSRLTTLVYEFRRTTTRFEPADPLSKDKSGKAQRLLGEINKIIQSAATWTDPPERQ